MGIWGQLRFDFVWRGGEFAEERSFFLTNSIVSFDFLFIFIYFLIECVYSVLVGLNLGVVVLNLSVVV